MVSEKGGAVVPPAVQDFANMIQNSQPALEAIVRKARTVPGANLFTSIIIVDGKPCLLSFKDGVAPQDLEKEVAMMGEHMAKSATAPANLPIESVPAELLQGVEKMLRVIYSDVKDTDVMGAIWSPHHGAAMKVAEMMEAARKRDRVNIVKGIQKLLEHL